MTFPTLAAAADRVLLCRKRAEQTASTLSSTLLRGEDATLGARVCRGALAWHTARPCRSPQRVDGSFVICGRFTPAKRTDRLKWAACGLADTFIVPRERGGVS